jgi:hypothetical protein
MIDNNVNENIIINKNNGMIEINDLNIGNYDLNIIYKCNNIILKENIRILINPYINYSSSLIDIKYGTFYKTSQPNTSHTNGIFSCKNLPKGINIDAKTGIIIIKENTDINLYNLTIIYSINNLSTTTNIFINIIS